MVHFRQVVVPGNSLVSVTSDATVIDTSHGDQPPQKVLQNAISSTNSSNIITWNGMNSEVRKESLKENNLNEIYLT